MLDDSFPDGVEQDQELCHGISRTLVDTLVELHAVDVEKAGLGTSASPMVSCSARRKVGSHATKRPRPTR